jgi:hypothetical protein
MYDTKESDILIRFRIDTGICLEALNKITKDLIKAEIQPRDHLPGPRNGEAKWRT